VAHSTSPAVLNAAFTETGHDGVYLPLLVNPGYESFKAFMESFVPFEGLDLSGLSVTLPHKENALKYLREKGAQVEELAQRVGAVNTIAIDRSDRGLPLRGLNTDYGAILDSITDKMKIDRDGLSDLRVAVIGAGGTGRARSRRWRTTAPRSSSTTARATRPTPWPPSSTARTGASSPPRWTGCATVAAMCSSTRPPWACTPT